MNYDLHSSPMCWATGGGVPIGGFFQVSFTVIDTDVALWTGMGMGKT